MPSVDRPRPALPQLAGDQGAKFQHLPPHRFIGDVELTPGEQIFHVPERLSEREHELRDRLAYAPPYSEEQGRPAGCGKMRLSYTGALRDGPSGLLRVR
jgi:hypothetical protein